MAEELYDVWAVDIESSQIREMARGKALADADAIVSMAVTRRGVDEEFYGVAPAGRYKSGDKWEGSGEIVREPEDPDYFVVGGMMYPSGPRGLDR